MRPGAVVVDLAAESGGNCEVTKPGETIVHGGVHVHGPVNVAASIPEHASQMLARNIQNYLMHLIKDAKLELDLSDELTSGPLITKDGEVVHEGVRAALEG